MTERLKAKVGLMYPVGAGLAALRAAGGFSRMTPEARAAVEFKRVQPGEYCDDIPTESLEARLALGDVERVTVDEPPKRRGKKIEEAEHVG